MQRQEEGSLKGDSARGQAGGCGPWARQWEKRSWEDRTLLGSVGPPAWSCLECGSARPGTCTARNLRFQLAPGEGGRTLRTEGGEGVAWNWWENPPRLLHRGGSRVAAAGAERRGRAGSEGRARGRANACTFLAAVKGPSEKKESLRLSQQMLQVIKGDTDFCYL